MTSLQRLLTAALAVALLLPAAAHASSSMETGIADDAALLNEPSDAKAAAAVPAWAALGIDDVRIFVQWQAIAPANSEVKAPDGFNSADPDSPGYNWSRVDRAVSLVSAAGMRPLLVVTGPGPLWASQVPARHSVRYKPRPDLFGQFARAAALRYGGAVDRWIIWNEPNLPLWLQPQNTCVGKRCTPYAPHLYRRLVRAAYPAIKAVDPTSTVLFGALAPRGENADQAERPHDAAGLHPLDGVRQGDAQARPQRPLQGLPAAHRRRPRLPPPCHDARARRAAAAARRGRDRRPAAPGAHARRARSAPAG